MSSKPSTYARKQKAAAIAASRWGNADREKPTFEDIQCQIGDWNVNDAEANRNKYCAIISNPSRNPCVCGRDFDCEKLDVGCEKTVIDVRTCERSFQTWTTPVLKQLFDMQSSRGHWRADTIARHYSKKEACKLPREFQAHIDNAKHTKENPLTNIIMVSSTHLMGNFC